MSHQCIADAAQTWEDHYAGEVRKATFGHLAPAKNRVYRGHVVFAIGCYECGELNPTALACEFKGLDDSPWFYETLTEFMQTFEVEVGCVYRWDGDFKNYEFKGVLQKLQLVKR